jgi:hypothetical protein
MFKAIYLKEERDIVSLDETWNERITELRQWAEEDQLGCPHCRHAVRVRAGALLRRHFAHKALDDCPYSEESLDLLKARAVLYQWLSTKFPGKVRIEEMIRGATLTRPVDCRVDIDGRLIYYWIFDSYPNPETRDELSRALESPKTFAHWIFLSKLMKGEEESRKVSLPKTQRDFLRESRYDASVTRSRGTGKSLHFLDPQAETLTTYRGLRVVHEPQLYEGEKHCTPLSLLQVHKNGEFVHPDEQARYKAFKEAQEQRQRELERRRKRQQEQEQTRLAARARLLKEGQQRAREAALKKPLPQGDVPAVRRVTGPAAPEKILPPEGHKGREGVCVFCGARTRDWWFYDGKTGSCKCKKCLAAGRV